jgi:Protein of unknown function DUF115
VISDAKEQIMDQSNPHVATSPTLNPYKRLLGVLFEVWPDAKDRLRWDLQPESRISRQRMQAWLNRHQGKKAVILCNGPSLNQVDFDALARSGVFTFGLNKINLLFNRTAFRPSCIVAVNQLVLEQNAGYYNETDIPLFIAHYAKDLVKMRENVHFIHSVFQRKFARDCSISVGQGATVTNVALQLAFHMGFSDVALVGCDHSFAEKGPANKTVTAGKVDHSHFDPNYFAGGVKWQLPDLLQSEVSYTVAREVFEAHGRRLVNATEGGKLEIFERTSLNEFLKA